MTQTTGVTSNGTAVQADTSISNPASTMGENDFLKLLVAQLQYQDPMNPTGNDQFMQEQAQFSTVEGINNLQKTMQSMQADQQLAQSVSLIGKQVTYIGADGASTATGVVSSVTSSSGSLSLTIGGQHVDPSSVVVVEAAPQAKSTTTTGTVAGSTTTGTDAGSTATSGTTATGTDAGSTTTGTGANTTTTGTDAGSSTTGTDAGSTSGGSTAGA
jgi:flagellar basal-body rod modification protein FlgD